MNADYIIRIIGRIIYSFIPLLICFGCTSSERRSTPELFINASIQCIVPDIHEVKIGEYDVTMNSNEFRVLGATPGVKKRAMRCDITLVLSNATKHSYLLSEKDVRNTLVLHTVFGDEHGNRWKLQYSNVRAAIHGDPAFTIPCVAGTNTSRIIQLGGCTLVPATEATPARSEFPKRLDYELDDRRLALCLEVVKNTIVMPATEIRIKLHGRCEVGVDGCQ